MKKSFTIIVLAFVSITANAQVGINTEEPKTTFHVKESDALKLTFPEGIMTPKFTGNDLILKDNLYTEGQTGAIVYVTEIATEELTDKTVHVNSIGYYYFDGLVWQKMNKEPWKIQGTTNESSNNNENIYQKGNVAIGTDENYNPLNLKLHVNGDLLVQKHVGSGNNQYGTSELFGSTAYDETSASGGLYNLGIRYKGEKFDLTDFNGIGNVQNKKFYSVNYNILQESGNQRISAEYSTHQDSTNSASRLYQTKGNGISGDSAFDESRVGAGDVINVISMSSSLSSNNGNSFLLQSVKNRNGNAILLSNHERGVNFQFSRQIGSNIDNGNYTFPQSNGTKNQVLVTSGTLANETIPNSANLSWKSIDDITHEKINIKSANGSCFQITVSNTGVLGTTPITCPL